MQQLGIKFKKFTQWADIKYTDTFGNIIFASLWDDWSTLRVNGKRLGTIKYFSFPELKEYLNKNHPVKNLSKN